MSSTNAHPGESGPGKPIEFGTAARKLWSLDPDLVFLNHGSFGAVPTVILERAAEIRRELERNPVAEVWRHGLPGVREAAARVAEFVGGHDSRTGFVTNATAGMNAMLQSFPLDPGDEVLHIDQGYNAIWQTLVQTGRRRGIVPRKVELPLPITGTTDVLDAFARAFTGKTRLLVLDQITSPTALVLPVTEIVELAAAAGIRTIVDGAHAPGMIDRCATAAESALAWTGNLHKWPCGLRGAAVITVSEELAGDLKPPVVSHHLDQSFAAEFDWQGTQDPTAWIIAPEVLRFMDRFGGWDAVRRRNRRLTIDTHRMLCERFGSTPICPLDGSMTGFMATVELPRSLQPEFGGPPLSSSNAVPGPDGRPTIGLDAVHRRLLEDDRIEVPIVTHRGRRFVRFSVHVYNHQSEYEHLAEAILRIAAS